MKLFKKFWGMIGIIFLSGLVLILFADAVNKYSIPVGSFLAHVGIALIISAIIGICLEVSEFQEFLEKRIIGILFGDEYIQLVNTDSLLEMNLKAMNALGKKRVTNPDYNYQNYVTVIGRSILDNIGTIYRKGFIEVIDFRVLKPEEITKLVGDHNALKDADIVCINSTTKFLFVIPNQNDEEEFQLECSYKCSAPVELLNKFKFEVLVNDIIITDVDGQLLTSNYVNTNGESLAFDFKHSLSPNDILKDGTKEGTKVGYEPSIEYRRVSYQYDPGSLNGYMNTLTHQIDINFSSREEVMPNAEFFGFSVYTPIKKTGNFVSINNPDWGLPEDGYFISWQRKKPYPWYTSGRT